MSPRNMCATCNDIPIGEKQFGCHVCNRIKISKGVQGKYYLRNIMGLPLPYELLKYIAVLSIEIRKLRNIVLVNDCVWMTRNHGSVYRPVFYPPRLQCLTIGRNPDCTNLATKRVQGPMWFKGIPLRTDCHLSSFRFDRCIFTNQYYVRFLTCSF